MPGIGLVIDGAMQQAPQPGRQACSGTGDELGLKPEAFTAKTRIGARGAARTRGLVK
jgi:hypothetical protein